MTNAERVMQVIGITLGLEDEPQPIEVQPTHDLREDLGADSLDLADLTLALEVEFDIHIPDEQGLALKTVQAVIDFVDAAVAERRQGHTEAAR